tara:strand:- start:7231 stop:7371 length:141 start_codon:yes stop_codon:yes gene_type:complete
MKRKKIKKTALGTVSVSIAHIPSISSYTNLPYVSKAVYLGEVLKNV